MLPLINGKAIVACNENDLQVLLDNPDYRENEYIDYKVNFSFLESEKGRERNQRKTEYKVDICSFANADGGYLIYGVREKNGCASALEGIEIPYDNTDQFELERRNDLTGIQPKVPQLQFSFIRLQSGKYIVIILVQKDRFAPYIFLEDEKNYKVYRHYGNGKKAMSYSEIRQMFNQSMSLEQEINNYRHQRIKDYYNIGSSFGKRFVHISFIPDTFCDSNYRQNMYILEKSSETGFSSIFSAIRCNTISIPCVDGIHYIPYSAGYSRAEGYVKNNGIIEACLALDEYLHKNDEKYPEGFFPWGWVWDKICDICEQYFRVHRNINKGSTVFICLSIIGCWNATTEDNSFHYDYVSKIDRDEVLCDPVEINTNTVLIDVQTILKKLYITFLLSIGVKHDEKLAELIKEAYENEQQK